MLKWFAVLLVLAMAAALFLPALMMAFQGGHV